MMRDDKLPACLPSENNISKTSDEQDSVPSFDEQTDTSDGKFDESTEKTVTDKSTLSACSEKEASSEAQADKVCKSQTGVEVYTTKETNANKENEDSGDPVLYTIDTSPAKADMDDEPEQQEAINSSNSCPPQQSQDVLDCHQVQHLLDTVMNTIEHQTEIGIKDTDMLLQQQYKGIMDSIQAQPIQPSEDKSLQYREDVDSSDDDTSSTFSLSSSSDCSDSFLEKMHRSCSPGNKIPNIKTKGELDLDELPPIEDLTIDITEREMQKVGTIYAIVEKLVIVRALKDLQPLDLDSVLFLSSDKTLGRVFDVFGPVVEPFYSVRFNSPEHIAEKAIIIDSDVFFAPEKTDITSYVFVDQLRKQKGSDASWLDENEPPEEFVDYSDDEQERAARRKRRAKNRNHNRDSDEVQVIPNKVSRDAPQKNSNEIHPWVDIQQYQQSLSLNNTQQTRPNFTPRNPFQRPYSPTQAFISSVNANPSTSSPMPSDRYAGRAPDRYAGMASQGGMNGSAQRNQQNMQPQFRSQPPNIQRGPDATYFPSPRTQFPFQSQPPPSPMTPVPPMNFMYQSPRAVHPGMAPPGHVFGQVPFFSNGLPSPMGMPPPPSFSPVAFSYRLANQPGNGQRAMNQPANFASQQPPSFAQNPWLAQGSRLQRPNGPPSPYGMTPLSVSIPNTPPSNAIYTPVPSPYNMWGSKSLNFPQSGYFGNNRQ